MKFIKKSQIDQIQTSSNFRFSENKAYELKIGSEKTQVYCVMEDADMGQCTGGGWTLVMKINGTKVRYSIYFDPCFSVLKQHLMFSN